MMMMREVIRKLTTVKKTSEITSEQALSYTRRVEVQTAQKELMGPQKTIKNLML